MLNALALPKYTVRLHSSGNPDHGQYAPVSNPEIVETQTIKEAIQACFRYQDKWGLGGGNWPWIILYSVIAGKKKRVGYISYNGRLWADKTHNVEIPVA